MSKEVQRVERHIVVNNKTIDNLCFLSKNLYNYSNYILRQVYLRSFDHILEFKDLVKEFKYKEKVFCKINEYDLTTRLAKVNQPDYRALPAKTSQQVIKLLYKNWSSFFKSVKAYNIDKTKFKSRPKIPKYKEKVKGRNGIVFTNQQIALKDSFIHFPKQSNLESIKTKVTKVDQVRIIPQATCYVIEVVYTKEVQEHNDLDSRLYLGIDLGINNLATCVNNIGLNPFIVNGKVVKSINQYYNKTKSYLQRLIKIGTTRRIQKLTLKRSCKIEDYFHKTSRFIINYCLEHKIKTIVVGKNSNWKNEVDMGKVNNQNFVSIPHDRLIKQLRYKGEEVGVEVLDDNESHTSKCSFLDLEEIRHHDNYLGKRVYRGLFKSSKGVKINADVNGAYNILRKVVPEIFGDQGIEGLGLNPIIVNMS